MRKKIMVFSGAGLSKESGVETFRDSGGDGLWNKHKIEDVATPEGWRKDKELVLNFYNARRSHLKEVEPNDAHKYIAKLEEKFDVINITQNVDNLLERAGSTNVIHLHGDLTKSRSTLNSKLVYDCDGDINIGDKCEKGSQLRPHIIWFNEQLDPKLMVAASQAAVDYRRQYTLDGSFETLETDEEKSARLLKEKAVKRNDKIDKLLENGGL